MDRGKLPLEGTVGHDEEHGGNSHVLVSPTAKHAVGHVVWET